MPRGAIPTPRNELAASEPYRLDGKVTIFVPSGKIPTPNHELVDALPYRAGCATPESILAWPIEIDFWGNDQVGNSIWAEEAFAKACAEPKVFIPTDVVLSTQQKCGLSNFAEFMQTHGFHMARKFLVDGTFNSVDWANAAALNSAIAHVGPVKIGVGTQHFLSNPNGAVTPGASGWAMYGLSAGQPENHFASLCGYGALAALVDLFWQHGVNVNLPSGMPTGLCYAMFTWGSIGIIDQQSLMNITGEAWIRNPTTIIKD